MKVIIIELAQEGQVQCKIADSHPERPSQMVIPAGPVHDEEIYAVQKMLDGLKRSSTKAFMIKTEKTAGGILMPASEPM